MPRASRAGVLVAGLLVAAAASLAAGAGPRAAGHDRAPQLAAYARQRFRAGDFAAALALRRRVLRLAIRDPAGNAAPAMAGLAALYVEMQRYLDAEPLLIAARRDLLARARPHDPALVPVLCGLARIAQARGEAAAAGKWAAEAVALVARQGRRGNPRQGEALRALGGALAAEKRFADSARVLRRALALDRASGGRDGPMAARDLAALGTAYVRQKRFAAALPPIEEAASLDQARLGPTHPTIADDYHQLGIAYLGLGRPVEAAAALRFAVWVLARGAGSGTVRLAYTELTLARALQEEGQADRAKMLFDKARKILGKAEQEEHRRERRI